MMSPVVRLDEEVFGGLKKIAEPLEDTPNSVIRRLLEDAGVLPKEHPTSSPRNSGDASRTSQQALRLPILQAIAEMGGSGRPKEVLEKVTTKIKDKLTSHDCSRTSSGGIRWRVYARWMRLQMKGEGLIGGPDGVWTITEKGRSLLKDAKRHH